MYRITLFYDDNVDMGVSSEFTQQDGRNKGDGKTLCVTNVVGGITCVFWRDLQLKLMFSGLYKKIRLTHSLLEILPKNAF